MDKLNNLELSKSELDQIKIFEDFSYENVHKLMSKSNNEIFFGVKDGRECIIKKYLSTKSVENLKNEIYCYQSLPPEILLNFVEANIEYRFLTTEKANLQVMEKNTDSLDEIFDLYSNKLVNINCNQLSVVNWDNYEKVFIKLQKLEEKGVISNADLVVREFKNNQQLIENAPKVFSQHDFTFRNIQKADDRLVLFDFEFACRDNAMCDMAYLYSDIENDDFLEKYFKNKLQKTEYYNEKLFDLMELQRCIVMLYAFNNKSNFERLFDRNLAIFKKFCEKCGLSN